MFEKPFNTNENEIVDKEQNKSLEHIPTPEIVKAIEKLRKTILAGSAVISAMVFLNTDKAKEIEGELTQTKDRLIEAFKDLKNSDTYSSEGGLSDEAKLALKTLDEYEATVLNYDADPIMPIRPGYVEGKIYGDAVEYIDDKYGSGIDNSNTVELTNPAEDAGPIMPIRPGYVPGKEYGDAVEYIDDKYGSGIDDSNTIELTNPVEDSEKERMMIIYEFLKGTIEQMETEGLVDPQ